MAGMWGLKVSSDKNISNEIFKRIINSKKYNSNKIKDNDQLFLKDEVYNLIKNNSVIHDSYTCKIYKDSKPFPTKRDGLSFIGSNNFSLLHTHVNEHCPIECRPINHSDWIYC
jgi:hypothetical protein